MRAQPRPNVSSKSAHEAIDLGNRQGVAAAAAFGRCALARCTIFEGDVALLDEVAASLFSEDLDPLTAGCNYGPFTELGRSRLVRGDLAGAEQAFVAAHEMGWEPQPGLALVRLAQGDAPGALRLVRDALDNPVNMLAGCQRASSVSAWRRDSSGAATTLAPGLGAALRSPRVLLADGEGVPSRE